MDGGVGGAGVWWFTEDESPQNNFLLPLGDWRKFMAL
jgi:hypothetical protein